MAWDMEFRVLAMILLRQARLWECLDYDGARDWKSGIIIAYISLF